MTGGSGGRSGGRARLGGVKRWSIEALALASYTRGSRSGLTAAAPKLALVEVSSRTIIIGDVHGCVAELDDLLTELRVDGSDRIVFVGDLVGRGPDTLGVLRMARELGAIAVQGNHERRLLDVHHAAGKNARQLRLGPSHRRIVRSFGAAEWGQLEQMPLLFELPAHDLVVVHAGLDPSLELDAQDPWVLTHVRSLDERGRPSHRAAGDSWAARWLRTPHVVFGHHALASLQLHPHATGLDTGCVYGGRLTALVLEPGQKVLAVSEREAQLVSVPARRRYFEGESDRTINA